MTWAEILKGPDRVVRQDELGEVRVSTVFLGIDHNFWGHGPPLIFETMVFGGPSDQYQQRYSTEAAALAGHDQVVSAVRDGHVLT